MKKVSVVLSVLLIILFVSCSTANQYKEITEEEAEYSMNLAMVTAFENTIKRLSAVTDKMNTIPPAYKILAENRDIVPGLNAILNSWDEAIKEYFKANLPLIKDTMMEKVENLKFDDPLSYISSSNTSGSELFSSLYFSDIEDFCVRLAKSADYSILKSAINQYNLYLKANDFLYKTKTPEMEFIEADSYFSDILVSNFLSVLFSSEELYRTTPDPYKDRTAAVVFSVE